MPVFFYRQAYITRPSKKNRCVQKWIGNLIIAVTLPIGIAGVYMNVKQMMKPAEASIDAPKM